MNTSYVVWDHANRRMETFAGPCRLAKWTGLPEGWGIERFLGSVSQGLVTLADVRAHCEQLPLETCRVCSCDLGRVAPEVFHAICGPCKRREDAMAYTLS